jgi:hypothetical protein
MVLPDVCICVTHSFQSNLTGPLDPFDNPHFERTARGVQQEASGSTVAAAGGGPQGGAKRCHLNATNYSLLLHEVAVVPKPRAFYDTQRPRG